MPPDSQSDPVFLPTRSYRRAEEWSLVLVSQNIPCRITRDHRGCGLLLLPKDTTRAVRILQVYQKENRHWYRYFQPMPATPGPGFHPGVILWALFLSLFHAWQSAAPELRDRGVCDTTLLWQGEVWRLWTAVSLHADLRHLMGNLVFGSLLLGLAMARFGYGWTQLVTLLGGVAGNILSVALRGPEHRLLGASGMVMAALGLLATGSIDADPHRPPIRAWVLRSLFASLMLFVLLGLDPASDVLAHAGGFIAGLLLGLPLRALPDSWHTSPSANRAATALTLLLILGAWTAALTR